MTRKDEIQPPSPDTDEKRILDRHNEVIGRARAPELGLESSSLVVEVTDTLHHLLGLEEGRIAIPRAWVAGIRRDEIRLSVAIHDPVFRSSVPESPTDSRPPPLGDPHSLSVVEREGPRRTRDGGGSPD